jgi:uncharacterized membrane protein
MAVSPEGKFWPLAKDLLTLAIIPLLAWIIKIEVSNAQRDTQIQTLLQSVSRVNDLDARVQQNAIQMARMEEKIDAVNRRLDTLQNELRDYFNRSTDNRR